MARKSNVSFASEIRAAGEHALTLLEDGLADYAKRAAPQTARDNPDETQMRKDVREFIRRLEAVGLTVESTPGHYRVLRDGKPLRKEKRHRVLPPEAARGLAARSFASTTRSPLVATRVPGLPRLVGFE